MGEDEKIMSSPNPEKKEKLQVQAFPKTLNMMIVPLNFLQPR
jgi:hypothetical protein